MLSESVTNMNHPVEKIGSNEYRIYVDKKVNRGAIALSSPGYFTTTRESANTIMYRGIDVGYNSGEHTRVISKSNSASRDVNILTTWMLQDGSLHIVTDVHPNLVIGQYITISNVTENSALNGTRRVSEISENSFAINFRVPPNMQVWSMRNLTGVFKSSHSTKIYCNTDGLSVSDELVFDYASGRGSRFEITEISKDDVGVYALVRGAFDTQPKIAVKSHFNLEQDDHVKFTYETKVAYYNTTETDPHTHSLWLSHLPDITDDGRYGDDLSFIQIFHDDMNIYSSE